MLAALLTSVVLLSAQGQAVVLPGVEEAAASSPTVRVMALVRGATPQQVAAAQPPSGFTLERLMPNIGALCARVTADGLARLRASPAVTVIQPVRGGHPKLAQSAVVTGAVAARQELGLTGAGVVVAALDTGIDALHPDVSGSLVEQKCFVSSGCPADAGPVGPLAPESSGHGTHIAGIITGDGAVAPKGLAPGASLVMVRVFDDTSYGDEADWATALDWLAGERARLGLRVVNLSIGTDDSYPGQCDADWPVMGAAATKLAQAGVVLFGASGNEQVKNGLNAPACLKDVVSVGATYDDALGREPDTGTYGSGCADADTDAGTVVCFSNASDTLDLLAPGSRIRSAGAGGGVSERRGTSQATAHASAAAALLLELDPSLTPAQVKAALVTSGKPVVDTATGKATPLIDVRRAADAVFTSTCARRADLEPCAFALACDGGLCPRTGQCFQGACVHAAPAAGALPAAPQGCGCAGAGSLSAALAALLWLTASTRPSPHRKRGPASARSRGAPP